MHTQQITLAPDAHILVVKLAGIGDLLLATPALRALRESYPHARIDLLVTPDSAGLLNNWDAINNSIVLDKYLFDDPKQIIRNPRALAGLKNLIQTLRSGHYDAVLLLHHLTLPFGRRTGQWAWLVPQCTHQGRWFWSYARGRICPGSCLRSGCHHPR